MGLKNLIKRLFDIENRDVIINVTYNIKATPIKMPEDDEVVLFQFPEDTPKEIVAHFDRLLVEFQNSNRKFITTDAKIEFAKTHKQSMEVEKNANESNDRPGGSEEAPGQGQHTK